MNDVINQGVLLEDSQDLLVWGRNLDALRKIASPEIRRFPNRRGNIYQLTWMHRTTLDGLVCSITTYLRRPGTKANGSPVRFREAALDIQRDSFCSAREEYRFIQKHLRRLPGAPTESGTYSDMYAEFPYSAWHTGRCRISVSIYEQFTEAVSFGIERLRNPIPT